MAPNGNSAPWRRRRTARTVPCLGVIEPTDDGQWVAIALDGRELGTYRFRGEANEVLLLYALFPPGTLTLNGAE